MWDHLVRFSTWAEDNSGQIQILIAVFALWLAYAGYKKVLEQITISRDQEKNNFSQRNFEAKLEFLNLCLQISDKTSVKLMAQHEIKRALENSLKVYTSDEDQEELKATIEIMEQKISETEMILRLANKLSEHINKSQEFDFNDHSQHIHYIYEALIISVDDANRMEILKSKFLNDGYD
ncbi:hypothetical protein [Acinetobacter calcoaceticus]|uniref:hypothetical protein n=1 Tax=Acinetobacter calcoaceticus TaxID=471 RepID=UPI003F773BC8